MAGDDFLCGLVLYSSVYCCGLWVLWGIVSELRLVGVGLLLRGFLVLVYVWVLVWCLLQHSFVVFGDVVLWRVLVLVV